MTFLITTHHNSHTRHNYITEHLSEINYIPVMALDWQMFRYTDLTESQYKHQSLTLAYYQIAQTAMFQDIQHYTVMEDDLNVIDWAIMKQQFPKDFDLCYLTMTDHNKEAAQVEPYSPHFNRIIGNWWETPITEWSLKFATRFVEHIQFKLSHSLWLGHIDHELIKLNRGHHYGSTRQMAVGLSTNKESGIISLVGSISGD